MNGALGFCAFTAEHWTVGSEGGPMSKRDAHSSRPMRVLKRGGSRADRLEIFFDLVFVFAFYSLARTAATHVTGTGLLEELLTLMLLWRAWCSHILLANRVQPGEGGAPLVMFAAMTVVFVFTLAIPGAFDGTQNHVPAPLLITGCYAGIRVLHLMLFWISAAGTQLRGRLVLMARPLVVAVALLVCAAILPDHLPASFRTPTRIALWGAAVAAEYAWLMVTRLWNWAVYSTEHWAERFELIIIIVFGEAIISVGVGSNVLSRPINWYVIIAAVVEIFVTAALWWSYFDHVAPKAREALHASRGLARIALARDGWIYLHLPMIAGIILFALGAEVVLSHMSAQTANLTEPPPGPGALLTYSGVTVFFVSHVAFELRVLGSLAWPRVVVIVVLGALIPATGHLPVAADLAILPAVCVTLVVLEGFFLGQQQLFVKSPDVRQRIDDAESAQTPYE